MNKINYTFIIPHKDSPELLKRCLNSIPHRNDIQIIIVDDNSNENIVNFDEFPGNDVKLAELYFTKTNKGAGYARNYGLKYAKGKWILFADADDFYTENLSNLLDKYVDDNVTDIVYLNSQIIHDDYSTEPYIFNSYIHKYLSNSFYSKMVIKYGVWTPWTRMVKKAIIDKNQLKYEEIPIGNDLLFCLKCSKYANTMSVEKNIIYNYYRPQKGSITDKKYNLSTIDSRINNTIKMNKLYDSVNYIFKGTIIEILIPYKKEFISNREYLKFLYTTYNKYKYSIIFDFINLIKLKLGRKLHII